MEDVRLTDDHATCHRLALDHVLGLIANAGWSDQLLVRGSMLMTAYIGSGAREPADLDFVVIEDGWPVDELDPYPYLNDLAPVQQWPEVADGAGRGEMWAEEEFGTAGRKPRVSPEGLRWVMEDGWERTSPYGDLVSVEREYVVYDSRPGGRRRLDRPRANRVGARGHRLPGIHAWLLGCV